MAELRSRLKSSFTEQPISESSSGNFVDEVIKTEEKATIEHDVEINPSSIKIEVAEEKTQNMRSRSFYISDDVYNKLKTFSKSKRRSMSEVLNDILDQVLNAPQ